MAGNKMNTKTKGKEEKGKINKGVTQSNEDGEDIDFAMLRKPIPTSITGFAQARKIFDLATEELKELLSNECDLLYECKVCRNLFRSLANFISHKRVYCREKFKSSLHGHFINNSSVANELLQINRTEKGYQESLKTKNEVPKEDEDCEDRILLSKDITEVHEKILKTKGILENNEEHHLVLKKIPSSNVAVFQNMIFDEKTYTDNMRAQVKEIDSILSRNKAVLQCDGKFTVESSRQSEKTEESENVIQISDDDENEDSALKCKICSLQFSTQKTLKFHMKYKHLESRLVYPCPDCFEIFSTSWSVYRHLFKVHRKTAAQIRRLRESIQSKAFKMNNPPAYYEKRKNNMKPAPTQKITEEERLDQENQAWMDNMEGDGEVPRCGGCGRTFERRAALAAHTHTCQPRSRALARRPEAKKIEIQIRKDYNKGPISGLTILKPTESNGNKVLPEENLAITETQATTKPQESATEGEKNEEEAPMDVEDEEKSHSDSIESPEKIQETRPEDSLQPVIRLPFARQAEKSNLAAFKQRIQSEIDFVTLVCKKCDMKHSTPLELYEHIAGHVKWMRYACKLCNFKHYNFEKLPEHVKVVHKLKGDSDFYFSTVKAIDGTEAMIISRCLAESESTDEAIDANDTSPGSRRPSRCSSDSSRLSDDSSSSSTLKETGTRKRKMYQNKNSAKRKKDSNTNDDGEDQRDDISDKTVKAVSGDSNHSSNLKSFEENSSDLDEIEDKVTKRQNRDDSSSVASRRPVRKRTKPKNEDFEYDLSNLLKLEAQGYRDSQSVTTSKTYQPKKKSPPETVSSYDTINKDCCGALVTLSKKAAEVAKAHLKNSNLATFGPRDQRPNTFVRPMLPRIFARGEKGSPKKDIGDTKDSSSPNKPSKAAEQSNPIENELTLTQAKNNTKTSDKEEQIKKVIVPVNETNKPVSAEKRSLNEKDTKVVVNSNIVSTESSAPVKSNEDSSILLVEQNGGDNVVKDKVKTNLNISSVLPIKFRRQSLEVMKNPIINKNITDFSKAGMKTKILVIKPINRKNDGARTVNTLKFQTIKFKDPNKGSSSSVDKQNDQVMVVQVPKVPCSTACEKPAAQTSTTTAPSISNQVKPVTNMEQCDNIETSGDATQTESIREDDKQSNVSEILVSEPISDAVVQESVNDTDSSQIAVAST